MSNQNNGGPALPESGPRGMAVGGEGMTLRDYLAAKAMQGILASPTDDMTYTEIAENSYRMADVMLKEREK